MEELFSKVIGYEGLKLELKRTIDILNNIDKYKELGVEAPRGLVLTGDPGLGKTLIANEFLDALNNRFSIRLRKTKDDGDFVKEINDVFNEAKKNAPSVVFLDDIDKFSNEDDKHQNSSEFVAIQSLIDDNRNVDLFVISTSNDNRCIPRSLLRPGRLQEIKVRCPNKKDSFLIIKHFIEKKKFVSELAIDEISRILCGASIAEIENVINLAGIYAGYQNKNVITREDLIKACTRVLIGAPEVVDYDDYSVKEGVAYHEAGHSVIAEVLEPGSVNLVTIKEHENSVGGITSLYQDERYFSDMKYMETRVICLLGGKAATEVIYQKVDTGSNSDIRRVYDIVERFVDDYCSYGFDTFDNGNLCGRLFEKKQMTISSLITEYYNKAKKILSDNKEFLDKVKDKLMEKLIISQSDIKDIRKELGI